MKKCFKIICFFFLFLLVSCSDNIKFDPVQWKDWVESESTLDLRWKMSKDLVNNYSLKGMSKDEIIELLGEPENISSSNEFLYFLGHTGKGINTGTLKISFLNDIVYEVEIYQG